MDYLIALDSGGTKTNIVTFDTSGHIWDQNIAHGGNPMDIGVETATQHIRSILHDAVEKAPGKVMAVYAATAGIYYYRGRLFADVTAGELGVEKLRFDEDGRSVISSELSHEEPGCGLICGTGCSIWIRKNGTRKLERCGGWGYLLDTLGSGFILGRDALHAVCLAVDERAPDTLLRELIEEELKSDFVGSVPQIYAGGRRRIASLAYTVFEAAKRGDEVAQKIMWDNAKHIAELIQWADRHFEDAYQVIAGGGIVASFPEYMAAIRVQAPKRAELRLAQAPPVYGGAVEAMGMMGLKVDAAFRENFLRDYAARNAG